jgi:hypothetical protein
VDTLTFAQVADDAETVLDECRQAGLRVDATRMALGTRRLREIATHVATHTPADPWPTFRGLPDVAVITEASEFATLRPSLPRWLKDDRAVMLEKLKRVLGGPAVPTDETARSSDARNVLFELTLGAQIEASGQLVKHGEHPDVTVPLRRRDVLVQCKRVLSEKQLEKNMKDAVVQLKDDFDQARRSPVGLVAIDVSRIVNPEWECLTFSTPQQVSTAMQQRLSRIIENTLRVRAACSYPIIGTLFRFSTIAHDVPHNRYVFANEMTLVKHDLPLMNRCHGTMADLHRALNAAGNEHP